MLTMLKIWLGDMLDRIFLRDEDDIPGGRSKRRKPERNRR